MKVARLQTPGFIVGWVVLTPPTFKIIHPSYVQQEDQIHFDDIEGTLPAHSGLVVECRILDRKTLVQAAGFTACSPTDDFDLGVGIKKSLERAFKNLRELETPDEDAVSDFYKALLASGALGEVFRGAASLERDIFHDELVDAIEDRFNNMRDILRYGSRLD